MIGEDVVELKFRTGKRWVPKHLANMMEGLETFKMTYDEAIRAANNKLTDDYVVDQMNATIRSHFKPGGGQ